MSEHAKKPLVVLLGLGEMGTVHARNLSKDRRVRVGIASRRASVVSSLGAELSVDRVYGEYEAALKDEEVAGVLISTSVESHATLLRQCLDHGKRYIFCEKPFDYQSATIRELRNHPNFNKAFIMCAFMRRWDPDYRAVWEKLRAEGDRPIVMKCTSGDAEYPEKYRRENKHSYPILTDLSVHDVDLCRWLIQQDITNVFATMDCFIYPDLQQLNDADTALVVLKFGPHAKATVHLSRAFSYGYNVSTEIVTPKQSFFVGSSLASDKDLRVAKAGANAHAIDPDYRVRFAKAFEREVFAFVDVVVAKKGNDPQTNSSYATFDDALKATIVAEALIKSAKTGLPVDVTYD